MELTTAQQEIAGSKRRFRVVNCGRRFGKSTLAAMEMVSLAAHTEAEIAYIAPTYKQARDIVWNMLKSIVAGTSVEDKINESRLEINIKNVKGTKSRITLRGWESIETLRGLKFNLLVMDEVASMKNFWPNWEEIIRPTLTDYQGQVLFISTPKGFNHFYDLYNKEKDDKDYKSFHFTSYDNHHLPTEELDKAKDEMTEDRFAQEYMADFRKTEGLVYKEFTRAEHTYDPSLTGTNEPTVWAEQFLGIDFGFNAPACILRICKDRDNNFWVTDEFYKANVVNAELIELAKKYKHNYIYADPAEPGRIEEFTRAGCYMREVTKGPGSISKGIDIVRDLFKQNRIKIHRKCENLIWELETYSYPDKATNRNENEDPIKENDHAMDALRYALMTNSPSAVAYSRHFGQQTKTIFK